MTERHPQSFSSAPASVLSPQAYARWCSVPEMFFEVAAREGTRPCLWHKVQGTYRALDWQRVAREAARLALGLRDLKIAPGDRVVLVAENCPQWLMADMAIMSVGAMSVPTYTTNTLEDMRHILTDSAAKAAIVSGTALSQRVMAAAGDAPSLQTVIGMDARPDDTHTADSKTKHRPAVLHWDALLSDAANPEQAVAPLVTALTRTNAACIIYTSGTGGAPKGVVLSHGAILHNCAAAFDLLEQIGLEDNVFLSFLPLSHAYEHTAGQVFPLSIGAQIYYAEGMDRLGTNMIEARPTIMTAVPRLYEALHARITRTALRQGGVKAKLFERTLALGRKRAHGQRLGMGERLADRCLDILVRRKVAARFGGRLKALVSGGAPLNPDIGLFFQSLGLCILQGYGQTEAGPVVSCNPPGHVRMDTVGPPLRGVEVRLAEDGEIMVRGENLMQKYWNNPEATAETIRGGWLYTGDIGTIDEQGYIRITDRKKDVIVNSGGDNIAPQKVEACLVLRPEIAQAMVYGDRKPYLTAVLVADSDYLEQEAAPDSPHQTLTRTQLTAHMNAALKAANAELSPIERVRHFVLAEAPFAIDNGLMTPTMKIRRHKIKAHYQKQLEALYKNPTP